MSEKVVYLLYEGDEWLSTTSLILMGVFSSMKFLSDAARTLIAQRGREHWEIAVGNGCFEDKEISMEDVCADIYSELIAEGQTSGWATNYIIKKVEINKLEEI